MIPFISPFRSTFHPSLLQVVNWPSFIRDDEFLGRINSFIVTYVNSVFIG